MTAMLPKLFIGSSREAEDAGLLGALQTAMNSGLNTPQPSIDVVPWNNSPWKNLSAAVATLIESLVDYSYAVFILSADDELSMRGKKHFAARDNVIFEFGLFLAHLGPERTFLVGPDDTNSVIALSALRTTSPSPVQRPLRILTDLGTVYREGRYTIANPGPAPAINFEVAGVIRAIQAIEARTSALDATGAQAEFIERLQTASAEIGKAGKGDSYYSGQFFSRFRDIATLKAKVTARSVQDSVKDLLLYLERVGDLCDITQLAREQHHSKHVTEVWVFSDSPLEFRAGAPQDQGYRALRSTIIDNLRNGVKYIYFVGPDFHKDDVEHLVEPTDPNRTKMLQCIHVFKVPSQFFNTYFTLHFLHGRKGPDAIYMSSVMRDRRDLLIQVSDSLHVRRIYERISILKGETEHADSPQITRYVLR